MPKDNSHAPDWGFSTDCLANPNREEITNGLAADGMDCLVLGRLTVRHEP